MRRHLQLTFVALFVLAFAASSARAACDFGHPTSGKSFKSPLVQAFVSCGNPGGNSPNTTNEGGGVPTCKPPETFTQAASDPPTGWRWDGFDSKGQVAFTAVNHPLVVPANNTLNPPGDTVDLKVRVRLRGVNDAAGPATGNGFLSTVSRATFDDRVGGSMTAVDFPVSFSLPLSEGKASLKTSADAALNALGIKGLPPCTSIEVVDIEITDENGNTFAHAGTYLPELQ